MLSCLLLLFPKRGVICSCYVSAHDAVSVSSCCCAPDGGLQPLFVPRSASPLECTAAKLTSEVLLQSATNLSGSGLLSEPVPGNAKQQAAFVQQQLAAAEAPLVSLQRLYQREATLTVQPLRHPQLMKLLLSGVWTSLHLTAAALCCHSSPVQVPVIST